MTEAWTSKGREVKLNGRTPEAQAFRAERILDTAVKIASAGGYDAVQMRDVADASQVALATLYRYFPSKDHLVSAAVARELMSLRDDLGTRPPHGGSAANRAEEVLVRAFHGMHRNRGFAHAAMTSFHLPMPLGHGPSDLSASARRDSVFQGILSHAIWPETESLSDDQRRVTDILATFWGATLLEWLNDTLDAREVEIRLGLVAASLVGASVPLDDQPVT